MAIPVGGSGTWGVPAPGLPKAAEPARRPFESAAPATQPRSRSEEAQSDRPEAVRGRPPTEADPRLWAMLTRSERDYYFRNVAFDGLTYSPGREQRAPEQGVRRLGGHIDLKV